MNKKHKENGASEEEVREEIDFEPEDELGSAGALRAKMQKLRDELEEAKKKRDEYLDGWQRCKADSINSRKEAMLSAERQAERARESFIEDLLPVMDSFDMAYGSSAWESIDATWRSGIDQIRNQLLDVLSRNGIERYGKTGELLDPYLHEAVQEVDDVAGEPHSITKILRYGYKMGDKVMRPAQVIVKAG